MLNLPNNIGYTEQALEATKYMPYPPSETELIAEIEREKLIIAQRFR